MKRIIVDIDEKCKDLDLVKCIILNELEGWDGVEITEQDIPSGSPDSRC